MPPPRHHDRVALARSIVQHQWRLIDLPPLGDLQVEWLLDRERDLSTERLAAWAGRLRREAEAALAALLAA